MGRSARVWKGTQDCQEGGDVVMGAVTSSWGRRRRQGGGNVVKGAATSSNGRRRCQRSGDVTVTSGIGTISQQSDAFATML